MMRHRARAGQGRADGGVARRRRASAFTLIEMVMVLVIIGALARLAYPSMAGSYYRLKLGGAARRLQDHVRYAQQYAIMNHLKIDVVFDTANEQYRVADVSAGKNLTDPFTRSAGVAGQDWTTGLYMNYTDSGELKGVNLSSATVSTLRFSARGVPTDTSDTALGANTDIVLTYQGNTNTVQVTPETGVVTVQ